MSALFIKTVRSKRLTPEEIENLTKAFALLQSALVENMVPDATSMPSACSGLYVYALGSADRRRNVLEFIAWFNDPEKEVSWPEELNGLLSRFFGELQLARVGVLLERISLQKSLTHAAHSKELVSNTEDPALRGLYHNQVDALNIDFSVSVLPFDLEVLDPRIVTVKPGKANEMHRHAHETVFIFLKGSGKVLVDQHENVVKPGDFAFIPRWCNHQSVNIGEDDLVFLAVADFGLTGKSFVGNYLKTARLKAQ